MRRRKVREVDHHLHELLLEERHPESAAEGFLEKRVEIGDVLGAGTPAQVRVHASTLDGPRANEGDLDDEVIKLTRLEARQSRDLCARLHLEHPHGIAPAQHVVQRRVLLRDAREGQRLLVDSFDDRESVVNGREHTETKEIEFHESRIRAIVFVPLHDRSALHARVFDRHDINDGPIAQHHPARVDPEVSRSIPKLGGKGLHVLGDIRLA